MAQSNPPMPEGTDAIIDGAGAGSEPDVDSLTADLDAGVQRGSARATDDQPSGRAGTFKAASSDESAGQGDGPSWAAGTGAFFERFADIKTQGYDQARSYAVQGKDKATGALDELLRTINDAADQIDSKVGAQYGDYARRAAGGIADFNDSLKGKDVDDLFNEARALIARAPAVAVGTAAALGFVVARLAKAGLPDQASSAPHDKPSTKA